MSKGPRQDEPQQRSDVKAGRSRAGAADESPKAPPALPETQETPEVSEKQPRKPRRATRRPAIVEGAVRVFAEKGYFNATVAEIARAAGVADGTIYLYFKSKDELLLSVFDEKMGLLCGAAREAVETAHSGAEALRRVAALHLEAVERNPAVASVLIVEMRQSSPFVNKAEKPRLAEYLGLIADVVKRGQESGEFRPDVHPAAFKRALFGALDEIALGWLVARRKFDLDRTAREISEVFVRGLLSNPPREEHTPPPETTGSNDARKPANSRATETTSRTTEASGEETKKPTPSRAVR